jgi:hypothetical protein
VLAVHISRDLPWSLEIGRHRGHQQGRVAPGKFSPGHVSTAPLFVLPFTPLFLEGVERLTGRIIGGAVVIVLGVFLLTVKG